MIGARARLLVLLLCLPLPALGQARPRDGERVRADLAAIVSQVELERGAGLAYVGTFTAVNFIREHAVIYTVECGELPAYGGAFFTWSEIDGVETGELMAEAGPEGVRVYRGEELARFLARVELDPTPLREVYRRHYHPRPPPARR